VVKLKVRCPYCGFIQITSTIKKVRCFRCMKTYPVFYKRKRWVKSNNIVEIVEGSLFELHRLYEEYTKKKKIKLG
jgi:ribosomal protein S27E